MCASCNKLIQLKKKDYNEIHAYTPHLILALGFCFIIKEEMWYYSGYVARFEVLFFVLHTRTKSGFVLKRGQI